MGLGLVCCKLRLSKAPEREIFLCDYWFKDTRSCGVALWGLRSRATCEGPAQVNVCPRQLCLEAWVDYRVWFVNSSSIVRQWIISSSIIDEL